jgi:geranylgeranyl diphosphate synthase type I
MCAVLDHYTRQFLSAIEAEMKSILESDHPSYKMYYGMMHYHLGWVDVGMGSESGKAGKRIRPLICLLVCDAAGGNWEQAVPAAAAIELLHNFSLIHDDIEDGSRTRRGRKTVWELWGVPQSINAGDSMFSSAYAALARLADRGVAAETTVDSLQVFAQACVQLTRGQHLDMQYETQANVDVEQYLQMIAGKTAALLSAASEIGATIAGTDPERRRHFAEYGRNVGLAFQVHDDILGVWGNESTVGKSTVSDILTRKKTMPVVYGLARSSELRDLYACPRLDVQRAADLLEAAGAKDYAVAAADRYSEAAAAHLEKADPVGSAGDALRELTTLLVKRQN